MDKSSLNRPLYKDIFNSKDISSIKINPNIKISNNIKVIPPQSNNFSNLVAYLDVLIAMDKQHIKSKKGVDSK